MTIFQRAAAFVAFTAMGLLGSPVAAQLAPTPAVQTASVQAMPAVLIQPAPDLTDQVLPAIETVPPARPDRFATLAAAIAAQDAADADEATRCLAGAIYFESKGEPIDGQLAVAEVIINRAKSGRFPADVCEVVKQRGQFSFVHDRVIPAIDPGRATYRTALAVAKVAMIKAWESSAPRALFFHARRISGSPHWVKVAAIGNHVFYR